MQREISKVSDLRHQANMSAEKEKIAQQNLADLQELFEKSVTELKQQTAELQKDKVNLQSELHEV